MSFTWPGPRPFSTIIDRPLPAAVATSAIAAGIVFTVEIFPVSGSPIRVATQEFATRDTDSLPNTPFSGTLEKALRFHRSIIDGSRIGGMSSGYSEIVINNPSGEYDAYTNTLDGAHVIVRMGQSGASFDSFTTLYDGLVDGAATVDEETLTLHLEDDNRRLEIPVQPEHLRRHRRHRRRRKRQGQAQAGRARRSVQRLGAADRCDEPGLSVSRWERPTGAGSLVYDVRDRGVSRLRTQRRIMPTMLR